MGIMEKKMETTILGLGYVRIMGSDLVFGLQSGCGL